MNRQIFSSGWFVTSAVLLSLTLSCFALATESLLLVLVGICIGLLSLANWLANPNPQPQPPADQQLDAFSGKMVSMVALFEDLPFIDESTLAEHVNRAWNIELENDETSESFVVGSAPLFVIKSPHQMYVVNYFDSNYFENLEEVLDEVTELRLSSVIRSHQAWVSIDLVSDSQGLDPEHHYSVIGKLLNQMANQDCVALLLPDRMKLIPWDESVSVALDSCSPISKLCPSQPPVIPIDDNNPELVAAVVMAKSRFPEFVAAFENHQRDEDRDQSNQFAVKIPIVMGGQTEFMWINTTAIENGIIYGTLDNWPVALTRLRRGDRVRVAVSEINDWTYTHGAQTFGGFTTKVIFRWARDQKSYS